MQVSNEAQQNARRDQDTLGNAAATEGSVWQPLLRRFQPYAVLSALARGEEEDGRPRMPALLGGPAPDAAANRAATLTVQPPIRGLEAREAEGELPRIGNQEEMLPPGVVVIPSSPPWAPIDISPDSSSH